MLVVNFTNSIHHESSFTRYHSSNSGQDFFELDREYFGLKSFLLLAGLKRNFSAAKIRRLNTFPWALINSKGRLNTFWLEPLTLSPKTARSEIKALLKARGPLY